eukprot:gene13041-9522_t
MAASAAVAESADYGLRRLRGLYGGAGWALHALVFEFEDGLRTGIIQDNDCSAMPLTDVNIEQRGGIYQGRGGSVIKEHDRIVRIEGHDLKEGCPSYLCWSLTFQLESGAAITFGAKHRPWKGAPFSFNVPPFQGVVGVEFGNGQAMGLITRHLALWSPRMHASFPPTFRAAAFAVITAAARAAVLPEDVVFAILSMLESHCFNGGDAAGDVRNGS